MDKFKQEELNCVTQLKNPTLQGLYISLTTGVLLITGVAKLYGSFGADRIFGALDPFFHLRYRHVMIGAGLLEIVLAIFLLSKAPRFAKLVFIFWFAVNLMLYRFANDILHVSWCPCLGSLASKLPLSSGQTNLFLTAVVLYFFLGSGLFLVCLNSESRSVR